MKSSQIKICWIFFRRQISDIQAICDLVKLYFYNILALVVRKKENDSQ